MEIKEITLPRVAFHTLGCKLNFSETATIARDLRFKLLNMLKQSQERKPLSSL